MKELYERFKGLNGVKRINVMCDMFSLCVPLELRFLLTYLKDVCKSEYKLNELEEDVNGLHYFSDLKNLLDSDTRNRLIISSTLLNAENHECSKAIYDFVQQDLHAGSSTWNGLRDNKTAVEEISLLLTLVSNHPAFTFSEKSCIYEQIALLEPGSSEKCSDLQITAISQAPASHSSEVLEPKFEYPAMEIKAPSATVKSETIVIPISCSQSIVSNKKTDSFKQGKIKNLELKGAGRKKTYRIEVVWSSGKRTETFKTYKEIGNFHQRLLQLFPEEAQSRGPEFYIPALPHFIPSGNSSETAVEQSNKVDDYLRKFVSHVPVNVKDSDFVVCFFQSPSNSRAPPVLVGRASFDASLLNEKKSSNLQALNIHTSQNRNAASMITPADLGANHSATNISSRRSKWVCYPPISGASSTPSSPSMSCMNSRPATPVSSEQNTIGSCTRDILLQKLASNKSVDAIQDKTKNKLKLSKLEDWSDLNGDVTDDESARLQMLETSLVTRNKKTSASKVLDNGSPCHFVAESSLLPSENSASELDESSPPPSPMSLNQKAICTCITENGKKGLSSCMLHSNCHSDFTGPKMDGRLVPENGSKMFSSLQSPDRFSSDAPGFHQSQASALLAKSNNISESQTGRSPRNIYPPRSLPLKSQKETANHPSWTDIKNHNSDNGVLGTKKSTVRLGSASDNIKPHQVPTSFTTTKMNSSRQSATTNSPTTNSPAISLQYMGYLPQMFPHHLSVVHSPNGFTSVPPSFLIPLLHGLPTARLPTEILYSSHHQSSIAAVPNASSSRTSSADSNNSSVKSFCYTCGNLNHKEYDCKGEVTQELKRPGMSKTYVPSVAEVETCN